MKKIICSTLTVTLAPLVVLASGISTIEPVTAKPVDLLSATKQERRCTGEACTLYTANYNYRANYERAINNGIIDRPSSIDDEERVIQLAYRALGEGDRYEAAIRFAQALVMISERYDPSTALEYEQNLDTRLQEERGRTLREYLPTFGRIFPEQALGTSRNSYSIYFERAIANGLIGRPSRVDDKDEAMDLANDAIDDGDRYEAAIRIAQALVIISETESPTKALAFERRLEAKILEQRNQTLREFLPLFGRIFP
jgi:transposase